MRSGQQLPSERMYLLEFRWVFPTSFKTSPLSSHSNTSDSLVIFLAANGIHYNSTFPGGELSLLGFVHSGCLERFFECGCEED
jgi:hypothetical protein